MDLSTTINLVLAVSSFVLAVVSVVTVIITLLQNSKMIEESTRPVISIYTTSINPGVPMLYLVVKNFGHSPAYMQKFETDFDFSNCYKHAAGRNYIEDFSKCVLAPGQSRTCLLDYSKLSDPVKFSIAYKSSSKTYTEELLVDLTAAVSLPNSKFTASGQELLGISYTLQEMLRQNL
jgi:hypothetical protein